MEPVTSSLLGPNILLNPLFPNTLSLRSSLTISDQVSHPYKTTGKCTYSLLFDRYRECKGSEDVPNHSSPLSTSTVEPRYTNAPVHEQFGSRTNFPTKKVSDDERCLGLWTRKLATEASWEYRCGSVSCWLTNLVSVYEHFGSRTAPRNELSSWTEVPLYMEFSSTCYFEEGTSLGTYERAMLYRKAGRAWYRGWFKKIDSISYVCIWFDESIFLSHPVLLFKHFCF
jgi:hypothetical protein